MDDGKETKKEKSKSKIFKFEKAVHEKQQLLSEENYDEFLRSLAKIIRQTRQEIEPKLTQTKIAEMLGITQAAYSNIEAAKRRSDIITYLKIADILGVPLSFLIWKAEIPSSQKERQKIIEDAIEFCHEMLDRDNDL